MRALLPFETGSRVRKCELEYQHMHVQLARSSALFAPMVGSNWARKVAGTRPYFVFLGISMLTFVYIFINNATLPLGLVACVLVAAVGFFEGTRFDRSLCASLAMQWEFWVLELSVLTWAAVSVWAWWNNLEPAAAAGQILVQVALVAVFTLVFAVDAAPVYPRYVRLLWISMLLMGSAAEWCLVVFAGQNASVYTDEFCPINGRLCLNSFSAFTHSGFTALLFIARQWAYVLLWPGRLSLIQSPVHMLSLQLDAV